MRTTFSETNEQMVQVALDYLKLGYRPIPIIAGKKCAAVEWKIFQHAAPTEVEIIRWFSSGDRNIALVTGNGVAVVDIDDAELVDEVLDRCGDTPMRSTTPNGGVHLYYATRGVSCGSAVRMRELPIDLRCDGAYAVCPWSRSEGGGLYEWLGDLVPAAELPPMDDQWLRDQRPRRVVSPVVTDGDRRRAVRRARAYLLRVEGAIAGFRGHDRTFRVACVLAIKFGLSFEEAWPLFCNWNAQCEPPWSEKELLHKLQDALRLQAKSGGFCA